MPLNVFGQFYEKWVSVRERNINLLLETVIYIATTETVTCIITIEYIKNTWEYIKNCWSSWFAD